MNKPLFWSGLSFQILQFTALFVILISQINFSKLLLFGIGLVALNIASLAAMFIGATAKND